MKIRTGFVSNSSTTSFCIYGAMLSGSKLQEMFPDVGDDDCDFEEAVYEKAKEMGLEFRHPPYDYDYYLGVSWKKVGDDETGTQFRTRVVDLIEKLCGQKIRCETYEEAWRIR